MNYEAISTWSQVVSSILFAVALVWMFRKFVVPAIVTAQRTRNEEIAAAEMRRDEIQTAVAAMQREIAAAQIDAASIRERAQKDALREREHALAEAREAGERALSNAQGELQRSRLAARDALREELVEKALQVARSQAKAKTDDSVTARLVGMLVDSLERGGVSYGQ